MFIGETSGYPTPRGAFQKAQLQEIGLVDIHDSVSLFADGSGYGV
jgi:hypothetical protein